MAANDEEMQLPLLRDHQDGGMLAAVLRLPATLGLGSWCKVADASVLALHMLGFACSAFLLTTTSTASTASTCKASSKDDLLGDLKVVLQVVPMALACAVLYTTQFHWNDIGVPQPPGMPLVHSLCGIALAIWLSVCMPALAIWLSVCMPALIAGFVAAAIATLVAKLASRHAGDA